MGEGSHSIGVLIHFVFDVQSKKEHGTTAYAAKRMSRGSSTPAPRAMIWE
jgi:hypothetical protein